VTPACFTNVRRSISFLAFSAIAINSRFLDLWVVGKISKERKGLNELRNLISAALVYTGATAFNGH
jgi:hypothetical protein